MKSIPENWRDSVHGIVAAGRIIIEQRQKLTWKEYNDWLMLQPVNNDTSMRRIAAIALNPILANPLNASKLPAEWAKLYEFTFLPDAVLERRLANGGLMNLDKHQIRALRNQYPQSAKLPQRTAGYTDAQSLRQRPKVPSVRKLTHNLPVPDGKTAVSWLQEGLDLEQEGKTIVEAADIIGMSRGTYGKGRRVLLLAQRKDLNAEDRVVADQAIADMEKYSTIEPIHQRIIPLMTKVWGSRGRHGGFKIPLKVGNETENRRKESFIHAMTVLDDTCNAATSIQIPYLSKEEITAALTRVVGARYALGQLAKNLRRVSNG